MRRVPWRVSSRLADSDSESITPAATVMGVVHPCLDTGPWWRVYRRGRAALTWQQAVVSLQTVLGHRLVVGGRTALERQGYAHFLSQRTQAVYLYGPARPPAWLSTLPLDVAFVYRNSEPPLMSITTRWRS